MMTEAVCTCDESSYGPHCEYGQVYCLNDGADNVDWGHPLAGETVTKDCPFGYTGERTRNCLLNGTFSDPVGACERKFFFLIYLRFPVTMIN